jgi:hypothetical protein
MRPASNALAWAIVVATFANASGPSPNGSVITREKSQPITSARDGALATVCASDFEVFFYATGLRVFPQDRAGAPLDAPTLTGTAAFYHTDSPEPRFARPLHASPAGSCQASQSPGLVIGLSTVPPTGARAAFDVAGLPDSAKTTARLTVTNGEWSGTPFFALRLSRVQMERGS